MPTSVMQLEVLANPNVPPMEREAANAGDPGPEIHFYYPPGPCDAVAPDCAGAFRYRSGSYVWTVKTYGYLSQRGIRCRLTDQLPAEGIIVTHRRFLTHAMVPNPRQLFVCIVADHWRHAFAQLHVVQNRYDPMLIRGAPGWQAAFMPHWPETALIPRDPARGDRFSNVSYFGLPSRLAPQLRSAGFAAQLREHGFNFRIVSRDAWNDYSDTDAVLAVRSFAAVSFHKYPPTKLYNSWLAGVPALLGRESAYRAERRGELDYFEVRAADEILPTLIRLRGDPALRAAVTRNCVARAAEVQPARIAECWAAFLTTRAVPAYQEWRRRPSVLRGSFLVSRALRYAAWAVVDLVTRAVSLVRRRMRDLVP